LAHDGSKDGSERWLKMAQALAQNGYVFEIIEIKWLQRWYPGWLRKMATDGSEVLNAI